MPQGFPDGGFFFGRTVGDNLIFLLGEIIVFADGEAELAFGDVVKVITNIVTGTGYDVLPTNVGGSYRVIYTPKDPDGYEPISCHIDFAILGDDPRDDLGTEGEELTRSGRVLLVNDDNAEGHKVSGQAYWRERTVDCGDGMVLTNDLFWTHSGEAPDGLPERLDRRRCIPPDRTERFRSTPS